MFANLNSAHITLDTLVGPEEPTGLFFSPVFPFPFLSPAFSWPSQSFSPHAPVLTSLSEGSLHTSGIASL